MTFFHLIAKLLVDGRFTIGSSFENRSISYLTWITCAGIPTQILDDKQMITESLLMSLTVQGH